MIGRKVLRRDEEGATTVEMAFALPVLLVFIYGIFQYGVILMAHAGMQHALGEGARYATLYPTPSDTAITTKVSNSVYGMNVGTFDAPSISTPATTDCTNCRLLSVTYRVTPKFIFFNAPQVTLTRSKRIYLATV
jgi:Flp pilus assembly protein TadG